jgi:fructokinase
VNESPVEFLDHTADLRVRFRAPSLEKLLETSRADCVKLLDINLRRQCYDAGTLKSSLAEADILKLNEDEARELSSLLFAGSPSLHLFCEQALEEYGLETCLVTLGARGAFAASRQGEKVYVPGYRVELSDTVGAGDAFTAGFIHAFIHQSALKKAVEYANLLGALASTVKGGTAPIAPEEIEALRVKGSARIYDSRFS